MSTLLALFVAALALASAQAAASGFGEGTPLAIVAGRPLDAPDPRPALEARDMHYFLAPEVALFGILGALFLTARTPTRPTPRRDRTYSSTRFHAARVQPFRHRRPELSIDGRGGVYVEGERVAPTTRSARSSSTV